MIWWYNNSSLSRKKWQKVRSESEQIGFVIKLRAQYVIIFFLCVISILRSAAISIVRGTFVYSKVNRTKTTSSDVTLLYMCTMFIYIYIYTIDNRWNIYIAHCMYI